MTAVFEQHGIKFQYPENWKLEQSQAANHALEIYVVSPTGAFWSLLAFDKNTDQDALMREIVDSIATQYDSAESSPVIELLGTFNSVGYDVYFFCLDLLITNRIRCVQSGNHNLMLMYQAENREFDKMEPVFNAITVSLLSGLKESPRLVIGDTN